MTYGRGAGRPLHTCAQGMEKYDLLCYRPCRDGFSAFHASCFQRCPSDYQDHGALCTRPPHIYGKGCCCTIFSRHCCGNCPSGEWAPGGHGIPLMGCIGVRYSGASSSACLC